MGVQGLTPFLQKTCPEVVKQLPDRLRALSGKRIAIDGTLITQRFHFAPMPQQYRHVLSWYRLATHLRDNDIQAICVFDGKTRSHAKAREQERRRRDRVTTFLRGSFENDRLRRLRRLTTVMRGLGPDMSPNVAQELAALKRSINSWHIPTRVAQIRSRTAHIASEVAAVGGGNRAKAGFLTRLASLALDRIGKALGKAITVLEKTATAIESTPKQTTQDVDLRSTRQIESMQDMTPPVTHGSLAANVTQLYTEYCQSIPQLVTLPQTPVVSTPGAPPRSSVDHDSATAAQLEDIFDATKLDHNLSKIQHGLMLEEAKFWSQLVESVKDDALGDSVAHLAETLEAKSAVLSESYERRTNPPTSETYEESKEILRAMGIPCVEPEGPYEAEALAASLVVHGYADFVASEDTDVLVYDVPLIRNVGSSHGPLVLISGAEVRTVLGLEREGFIDFALLLGTDFSQRIKNVGPARALKFIREHGSIERVVEYETKYPPRVPVPEYLEQVELGRGVFNVLPPLPHPELLTNGQFDEKLVSDILDKYGLRRYATDEWDYSQALSGNYFSDNPAAT